MPLAMAYATGIIEGQAENPDKQWTQVVVITTKGLKMNIHSDVAKKTLTLDDLFNP